MINRIRIAVAALALAFPLTAAAQGGQDVTRTQYGDWTVVCAAGGAPCIMQKMGTTDEGQTALSMEIEKLAEPQTVDGQRVEAVGNFLVPLGVLLQAGLRLQVDSGEVAASPYLLCQQNGCIVRAPLQADILDSFRRGARARLAFTIFDNSGETRDVEVTVSLSGFTRAFNALP